MKSNTALFTVFHPAAEPFLHDFIDSLSKQTCKDFTLFLVNDGCPDIWRFLEGVDFSVRMLEPRAHPTTLRKIGIQWAISEGAESIIFADSDDFFADNRIEISQKMMDEHNIVCNEIFLTGQKYRHPTPMLGGILKDEMQITVEDIVNGNCLGLSNTAIKTDKISALMLEIPDDITAFDWTFFALCLHAGANAIFTNNTQTYYRQHGNNIASPFFFSEEQIIRGVHVKRDHYKLLSRFYEEYTSLADQFGTLLSQLHTDKTLRRNYCQAVRKYTPAMPLWWEPIKSLKELGL